MPSLLVAAAVTMAGLGCGDPPLAPPQGIPSPLGIIEGTVTVTGVNVRGDVYVIILPQAGSPGSCPAAGESLVSPLNLIRIDRLELFTDPEGASHSAPFVIPQVPPGCYSLAALLDADDDFNPLFGVTSGATLGDAVGGAFVEPIPAPPATPELRVIEVARVGDFVAAVRGVQVLVGARVPFERPSFTIDPAAPCETLELSIAAPVCEPQMMIPVVVTLSAAPLENDWIDTFDPDDPMNPGPVFPIILGPDTDGDFVPEDMDGDMAPDVFGTRVILRRLSDDVPEPATTTDLDEDFPLVIPGVIDVTPFVMEHVAMMMPPDGTFLFLAGELTVVVPPVAFIPTTDGSAPTIRSLTDWQVDADAADDPSISPLGRYAVIAILDSTNQTWQLPNELVLLAGEPSQADSFEVVE